MHDTITAVVESAHHDHDRRTEVDTGMAQLDETHRRHAASRLRECFRELWGHEVVVTLSDNNQEDPPPEHPGAAGSWRPGDPAGETPVEEGDYVVFYRTETGGGGEVDIFHYFSDTGWHLPTGDEEVICFAPIILP